jgi:hypothetical protein
VNPIALIVKHLAGVLGADSLASESTDPV